MPKIEEGEGKIRKAWIYRGSDGKWGNVSWILPFIPLCSFPSSHNNSNHKKCDESEAKVLPSTSALCKSKIAYDREMTLRSAEHSSLMHIFHSFCDEFSAERKEKLPSGRDYKFAAQLLPAFSCLENSIRVHLDKVDSISIRIKWMQMLIVPTTKAIDTDTIYINGWQESSIFPTCSTSIPSELPKTKNITMP